MGLKNKKLFITGGAGFIANKIISHVVNDNKITVYDNYHRDTLTSSKYNNHPNIEVIKGDVLDASRLSESMK
ncbi:MAG: NAD(P)-dependent oxidoreductase, partial [Bacteroidetes bacterium]|nr:NAD(P)-dependent oxidoreductase [Bacteroidota bacterium]